MNSCIAVWINRTDEVALRAPRALRLFVIARART